MEDRSYNTISRHGLGSSNSLLDGVPFKIAPSFKQPAKVVSNVDFYRPNLSSILSPQYSFDTEEGVLAWAHARQEAIKQAALEQAQKLAEQHKDDEKQKVDPESGPALRGEETTLENGGRKDNGDVGEMNVKEPNVEQSSVPSHKSNDGGPIKPDLPAKPASVVRKPGPDILKPTLIGSSIQTPVRKVGSNIEDRRQETASTFDVSMFESEADPLEDIELQTINDMEELKIMFDSSTKSVVASVSTTPSLVGSSEPAPVINESTERSSVDAIYDIATVVTDRKWETFDDDTPKQNFNFKMAYNAGSLFEETVKPPMAIDGDSGDVTEDGEYVEITNSYTNKTVEFHSSAKSTTFKTPVPENTFEKSSPTNKMFRDKSSVSLAKNPSFVAVLPPLVAPGPALNGSPPLSTNPFHNMPVSSTNPFLPPPPPPTQANSQLYEPGLDKWGVVSASSFVEHSGPGPHQFLEPRGVSPDNVSSTAAMPLPPPPSRLGGRQLKDARMWSSVGPSLAASLDESSSTKKLNLINPYSRHSLSSSDLHLTAGEANFSSANLQKHSSSSSFVQFWNKNRPLPPIPTTASSTSHTTLSTNNTTSQTVPELYKVSLPPPSQQQPLGLTDPYFSLSKEAQAFTDSLASMGFLRAKCARAVSKFGIDDKEVLDYLIAVDALGEKRYPPILVESALWLCKNDAEKAEKFIQMVIQFEELGFAIDKIQEALVATDMDYEKVLDLLTT